MFVGSGTARATYNRQQFAKMAAGLSGYERLASEASKTTAENVASLLFLAQVKLTNPEGLYVTVPEDQADDYLDEMDVILHAECDQIAGTRAHVSSLIEEASAGQLHQRLEGMIEPEPTPDRKERRNPPPPGIAGEIIKAANWISRSIHGNRKDLVLASLNRHVHQSAHEGPLGKSPKLLDQIYTEIVEGAPKYRGPNPENAYPSSGGGRYLLEEMFRWTAEALWPMTGDRAWQDVALFYLGAIGTVQGFPDGNKRVARMAYAITLLKGGLPFIAPNSRLEAELIRMDWDR